MVSEEESWKRACLRSCRLLVARGLFGRFLLRAFIARPLDEKGLDGIFPVSVFCVSYEVSTKMCALPGYDCALLLCV